MFVFPFFNIELIFLVDTFSGSKLGLFRVDRRQMGAYLCIASNDVPPAVSKRIVLHVNCKYNSLYNRFFDNIVLTIPKAFIL